MLYDKCSEEFVVDLVRGFDFLENPIFTTSIITDGVVIEDDNCYEVLKDCEIPYAESKFDFSKQLYNISLKKIKKVLVSNANYIILVYYVFFNNEWYVYTKKHYVNEEFNLYDNYKYSKFQTLFPGRLITDEFPLEVNYIELTDKIKDRREKIKR